MADHTRFKDLQETQKQFDHVLKTEALKRATSEMKLQDQISVASMADVTRVKDLQAAQKHLDKVLQSASLRRTAAESKVQEQFAGAFSQTPGGHAHGKELDLKIGHPSKYVHSLLPRIDFPRFDGSNPRAWMLKCNRFFNLLPNIHDAQRIHLASMHFDGRALSWFQDLNMVEVGITWKQFLEVVFARFELLPLSNIIVEFNELKQNGSYDDYVERFEELSAYILLNDSNRFSEDYFIAHFMSGLREELQSFLHIFQPRTLVDTIELGRKHLTTLDVIARKMKVPSSVFPEQSNTYKRNEPVPFPTLVPAELPPTKLLTSSEMATRIEKGLCSNCDEPFISGHRCKKRINYVLMTEEEELLEVQEINKLVNQDAAEDMVQNIDEVQISLHYMMEEGELTTTGTVREVGDQKLVSSKRATDFKRSVQGQGFQYSPRLLKIEGCDLILGGYWFMFCIPIEHNYTNMALTVFLKGKKVKFKSLTTAVDNIFISEHVFSSFIQEGIIGFNDIFVEEPEAVHARSTLMLGFLPGRYSDPFLEEFSNEYNVSFLLHSTPMVHLNMAVSVKNLALILCEGAQRQFKKGIGTRIVLVVNLSATDSTHTYMSEPLFALQRNTTTSKKSDTVHAHSTPAIGFSLRRSTGISNTSDERADKQLRIRDMVYLKFQSFHQNSVYCYPESSMIHPKFHASLLQRSIGKNMVPVVESREVLLWLDTHIIIKRFDRVLHGWVEGIRSLLMFVAEADVAFLCCKKQTFVQQLSKAAIDGNFKVEPLLAICPCVLTQAGRKIAQMLLHWLKVRPDSAIWEVKKFLHCKFPSFDPRGRGSFRGGGIVMYLKWVTKKGKSWKKGKEELGFEMGVDLLIEKNKSEKGNAGKEE